MQAEWQRSRRVLSWPQKIRVAEQIRESVGRWRKSAPWKALKDQEIPGHEGKFPIGDK